MRFGVSRVLDAIESRLTLDPALARAVLDLGEVIRLVELDGDTGKPATLLRLGRLVDALGRHLAEDGVAVYVVAARALLSDLDLTSNERMVLRRWADDGLVEVVNDPADRVLAVAELLGAPVLTRRSFSEFAEHYPWLPTGLLTPSAGAVTPVRPGPGTPGPPRSQVLTRVWQCPEPGCPSFGTPNGGQPPPWLRAAAPTCPRHESWLVDAGPRPPGKVLAVRVDGAVARRVVVREGAPVVVGRAPDPAGGVPVALGPLLGDEALRWVSRSHLWLELRGQSLVATDTSTNGTSVHTPAGPVELTSGQPYGLSDDDVVVLYQGVELGRPDRFFGGAAEPSSVMADAPTVSIRLPR